MKYADMINQIESFKYSCNLKYDLLKDDKLIQYMPTQNSLKAFKDIFNDMTGSFKNRQASRLIYGTYGSGKSSFLTVLASILGKTVSREAYLKFINKVKIIDPELSVGINNFIEDSLPYLIVSIDGNFNDFHQSLYYSLIKVLEEKNIRYELKDPYIEALKVVEKWGKEKNKDFEKLINKCFTKYNVDRFKLINELSNFDLQALEKFEKIFYDITYGIEFRPKLNSFYENLDIINSTILESGYRGIIFIFDEFGKYLEDNIENIRVKTIQDLAEYCDHSNFNNYIILVSHKEILQYADINKIEEWKKIESRFQPISFYLNDEEAMYLMKNALIKQEPLWSEFRNKYNDRFNKFIDETVRIDAFQNLKEHELRENIVHGIYPIHPVVGKMLIMLSKKIAQNERTIFTFLASNEEKSLGYFLKSKSLDDFHFIGADILYDYFVDNFLINRTSFEFSEWVKVKNSINKLDKEDDKYYIKVKILKTIGVINLINNYESIKPDQKTLLSVIDENEKEVLKAMGEMLNNKIIIYVRQYKYYRFFDASSIDVEDLVEKTMEISDNTVQAVELINDRYVKFPILPDEYNDEYKMTRYYYPIYILENDIEKMATFMKNNYYDGLIVYIITSKSIKDLIEIMKGKRIIYIYRQGTEKILFEAKKLIAIEYLLSQKEKLKEKDPKAILELQEYKKEIELYINSFILEWCNPENKDNTIIEEGSIINEIKSISRLSKHISNELLKCFDRTMIVNNELINKRALSTPMKKARKDIIDYLLLSDKIEPSFGYKNLSTNHTFVRSLLEANGILNGDIICIPEKRDGDKRLENAHYIMNEINGFIKRAERKEVNFGEIIDILKTEPYGLRDGYITVLIAVALRNYRECIYIRLKGKDQQLSGELFERISKNPEYYNLAIDHWPKDKDNYISALEHEFRKYINWNNRKMNRLKTLHEGLLNHYKSISKFSRTTVKFVQESTVKYREIIEKDTEDYRDFFFKQMLVLGNGYNQVLLEVSKAKEDLETTIDVLLMKLIDETKKIFKLVDGISINIQILDLLNIKWEKRIEEDLDYLTSKFIDVIEKLEESVDDIDLVEQIALLLTGFQVNYWSDSQRKEFSDSLKAIYNDLEKPISKIKAEEGPMKIALENEKGIIRKVSFTNDILSENGQILKNLLLANIDNFGQALSYESKRQIICEILMKYI